LEKGTWKGSLQETELRNLKGTKQCAKNGRTLIRRASSRRRLKKNLGIDIKKDVGKGSGNVKDVGELQIVWKGEQSVVVVANR